ncbi:trypsin-like peptidase domain-containing protein [Amycolatopsis kentuckyensis]|uniref:trypsin-like peptidase domain-containing protein n=1 Tax=Amycolatopsis kentuckyensis TaxID=218823 RepID=UPI003563D1A3
MADWLWDDRLVEVWAAPGQAGSGVAFGRTGVLTSRHVVSAGQPIRVLARGVHPSLAGAWPTGRPSTTVGPWVLMRVVADDPEWDLVVLEVDPADPKGLAAWLTPASNGPRIVELASAAELRCETVGFPDANAPPLPGTSADETVRQSEHAVGMLLPMGQVKPRAGGASQVMPLDVATATPEQVAQWGGMSGAGVVLADGRLAGIVVEVEPDRQARRLLAVPLATALAASPRLREALKTVTGHPVVPEKRDADRAWPLPLAQPIELFQANHLAVDGQAPIPFGGRNQQLNELTRWARDPAGPARFVVSAPPGRGKSTLLTRWWQQYRNGPTVFVPINIGSGTDTEDDVLRALVARLAQVHREDPAEASRGVSVGELRDALMEFLARPAPLGNPLVIIVDGLDEAADWDPAAVLSRRRCRLGEGVRLLVAARQTADRPNAAAWCHRLVGDNPGEAGAMDLEVLTEAGVGEALDSVRPSLTPVQTGALRPLLVNLTDGDPLALRLYLEELATAVDRDDWIATLAEADRQPGLGGYLKRWLEDQEQQLWDGPLGSRPPDVGVVFSVLACAFAPLSRVQLLELAARCNVKGGDALNAALSKLRRLVLWDPVADTYVMSHPLIAQWRREVLARDNELVEYDLLFANHYGSALEQWTEREWHALDPYALRHLTAHLLRSGQPELLHALLRRQWSVGSQISNGWYHAKTLNGQLDDYLVDVREAMGQAADLGHKARYALYLASIPAGIARIPSRLLELCVQYGKLPLSQAIDAAHAWRHPYNRARAIAGLLPLFTDPTRAEEAVRVELQAANDRNDHERGLILSALAATTATSTALAGEIIEAAETLGDDRHVMTILTRVAARLADEDLPVAAQLADSIDDPLGYVRALAAIGTQAREPLREELTVKIRAEIDNMEEHWEKGLALCALASAQPDPAPTIREVATLAKALDEDGLPDVLTALTQLEPDEDLLDGLLDLAERIYRDEDRDTTDRWYLQALVVVAPHLSPARRAARVGRFVDQLLSYTSLFAKAFADMNLPLLATSLSPERRRAILSGRIGATVHAAAGTGMLDSLWQREAALAALADLPPDQLEAAVRAKDDVADHELRARVLAVLLPQLDNARRDSVFVAELARVQSIHDEPYQAHALAALVPRLPKPERAPFAAEAVEKAGPLLRDERHAALIGSLAPHLLGDALDAVGRIEDSFQQSHLLAALVSYLPEAQLSAAETMAEASGSNLYLVTAAFAARRHAGADNALDEAVPMAREMPGDFLFVLERLAADLTDSGRRIALQVVEDLVRLQRREAVQALVLLAPHLHGTEPEVALAIAGQLAGPAYVTALAALTDAATARSAALRLTGDDREEAMAALARFPEDRPAALDAALAIRDDLRRSQTLAQIAPYLDGHSRDNALAAMLQCYAAPTAGAGLRPEMLRATLLDRLADTAGLLREQAASEVAHAVLDAAQWWP